MAVAWRELRLLKADDCVDKLRYAA